MTMNLIDLADHQVDTFTASKHNKYHYVNQLM